MWYVYIIRSINFPEQEYIGATSDLKRRLPEHNAGKSSHTSKFKPWELAGIARSLTNTGRWNSGSISNPIPAGHLQRNASDVFLHLLPQRRIQPVAQREEIVLQRR